MPQETLRVGKTVLLKCTASRGMLRHEAGVLIQGAERHYESMVDVKLVHLDSKLGEDEISATLDVQVVKTNGENVLIELPRQVVAGGCRIWVPQSEVKS